MYSMGVFLNEYFVQFNLIARVNGWNDSFKAVALASNLRGKARSVLDGVFEIENLSFEELKNKLELRFGERHLAQTYYIQFTNRKQRSAEDRLLSRREEEYWFNDKREFWRPAVKLRGCVLTRRSLQGYCELYLVFSCVIL